MKYSETGIFSKEQKKLAREIGIRLKKLKDSGCTILAKQWTVYAFLNEDIRHACDLNSHYPNKFDYEHPVPSLECGEISDSGADDTEYFEKGYITED